MPPWFVPVARVEAEALAAFDPGFDGEILELKGNRIPQLNPLADAGKDKGLTHLPAANPAPFSSVPLLVPTTSSAFPSPGHQATISAGAGEQPGGTLVTTVNKALELTATPTALETSTEYSPACAG